MIKTAVVFGGAWAAGDWAGGKLAAKVGAEDGVKTGVKIATGVVAFFLLSTVIR
jgi:hypothetical protein